MTTAVSLDLSPEAPHTPQRTAELAGRLAEIVGVLGEATKDDADGADGADRRPAPGIGWPVAPEDLLDRLARLAEGTEELYPRLAGALGRHQQAGTWRVAPVTGYARDLDEDLATVAEHLNEAAALAADVARHLYQARNLLSCVRPNYPRTDGAPSQTACPERESESKGESEGEDQCARDQQLEQARDQQPATEAEATPTPTPAPQSAPATPPPASAPQSALAPHPAAVISSATAAQARAAKVAAHE